MGWLTVLRLLLSLANNVAGLCKEKQLMDAGEATATAKQLAGIAKSAGIGKEVEAETAKMNAAQVVDDLAKHGELRD